MLTVTILNSASRLISHLYIQSFKIRRRKHLMQRRRIPRGVHNNSYHNVLKNTVIDYLRLNRWFAFHNHEHKFSHPGIADITAVKNGITVWIEIKTGTGELSDNQKGFRDNVQKHGGLYVEIRDLEEIIDFNEKMQKKEESVK